MGCKDLQEQGKIHGVEEEKENILMTWRGPIWGQKKAEGSNSVGCQKGNRARKKRNSIISSEEKFGMRKPPSREGGTVGHLGGLRSKRGRPFQKERRVLMMA